MPKPESLLQALATLPLRGQLEGALDEFVQALILCPTTASSEARCSLQKGGSRPGSWGAQAPVRSHLPPFPPAAPSWTWPLPERDFAPRPALVSGPLAKAELAPPQDKGPRGPLRLRLEFTQSYKHQTSLCLPLSFFPIEKGKGVRET